MVDPADFKFLALAPESKRVVAAFPTLADAAFASATETHRWYEFRYLIVDPEGNSYDEHDLIRVLENADPSVEEDHDSGDAYA